MTVALISGSDLTSLLGDDIEDGTLVDVSDLTSLLDDNS